MSDWNLYSGQLAFPGQCICGSQEMPMVDTGMEKPGFDGRPGRVYLCPRCVRVCSLLHSWIAPEIADEMLAEIASQGAEIERLTEELAAATDPGAKIVQVTAADLVAAIDERLARPEVAA